MSGRTGGLFDCRRLRAKGGKAFRLAAHRTDDTRPYADKAAAEGHLAKGVARLAELQDMLYAQDRWSVLLVLQAMDAAGKDGTIKHVMTGLNPQGCQVHSFKAPTSTELDHDFLWRTNRHLPERGRIGVFNRSYYEEVLVVRVRPELLAAQQLPERLVTKDIWTERYEDINAMERYLSRNGVKLVKVFLHVSKEEQLERLMARIDDPAKNWKFSIRDVEERRLWDQYMESYERMIAATSTRWAPWHVVPADKKWFSRLAVADVLIDAMEELDLHYPRVSAAQREELLRVRAQMAKLDGKGRPRRKS
jgi:PPK2 family polyphosphate:nucleotide phosphotransferase